MFKAICPKCKSDKCDYDCWDDYWDAIDPDVSYSEWVCTCDDCGHQFKYTEKRRTIANFYEEVER